jgi:hypothetical protein
MKKKSLLKYGPKVVKRHQVKKDVNTKYYACTTDKLSMTEDYLV